MGREYNEEIYILASDLEVPGAGATEEIPQMVNVQAGDICEKIDPERFYMPGKSFSPLKLYTSLLDANSPVALALFSVVADGNDTVIVVARPEGVPQALSEIGMMRASDCWLQLLNEVDYNRGESRVAERIGESDLLSQLDLTAIDYHKCMRKVPGKDAEYGLKGIADTISEKVNDSGIEMGVFPALENINDNSDLYPGEEFNVAKLYLRLLRKGHLGWAKTIVHKKMSSKGEVIDLDISALSDEETIYLLPHSLLLIGERELMLKWNSVMGSELPSYTLDLGKKLASSREGMGRDFLRDKLKCPELFAAHLAALDDKSIEHMIEVGNQLEKYRKIVEQGALLEIGKLKNEQVIVGDASDGVHSERTQARALDDIPKWDIEKDGEYFPGNKTPAVNLYMDLCDAGQYQIANEIFDFERIQRARRSAIFVIKISRKKCWMIPLALRLLGRSQAASSWESQLRERSEKNYQPFLNKFEISMLREEQLWERSSSAEVFNNILRGGDGKDFSGIIEKERKQYFAADGSEIFGKPKAFRAERTVAISVDEVEDKGFLTNLGAWWRRETS